MSDPIFFAPLKVPVTDSRTGLMSREWYLFFQAIFLRIGGTQAFSADDQQLVDDMNDATGSTIRTTDLESALTDDPQSSTDIAELQALALSDETIIARFTAQWDGLTPASNGGTVNFLRADGTWQIPAYPTVPVGANPTAVVGPVAVNGVAATFMRSDAAPAIDLTASFTWTNTHAWSFNTNGLVTVSTYANTNAGAAAKLRAFWGNGTNDLQLQFTSTAFAGTVITNGPAGQQAALFTDAAIPFALGSNNSADIILNSGVKVVSTIGFNNTAPIAKPAITGSRAANAALASFLTALANYGLITDSTTP